MILRVALLVVIVILLLAALGRSGGSRVAGDKPARRVESARKCGVCDAYIIEGRPARCDRADCPHA
jgi:hypothetical protein